MPQNVRNNLPGYKMLQAKKLQIKNERDIMDT
jgi:hypothetical protein